MVALGRHLSRPDDGPGRVAVEVFWRCISKCGGGVVEVYIESGWRRVWGCGEGVVEVWWRCGVGGSFVTAHDGCGISMN